MSRKTTETESRLMDRYSRRMFIAAGVVAARGLWPREVAAQRHRRRGRGRRGRMRNDPAFKADHETIQSMLVHRDRIQRSVTNLKDGVETLTETDAEALRGVRIEHVEAMSDRLEEGRPIHRRDPLFAELFRRHEQIEMSIELTERGVKVTETSEDPYVVKLIQSHAEVVSLFLRNGPEEVRRNHETPQ